MSQEKYRSMNFGTLNLNEMYSIRLHVHIRSRDLNIFQTMI